MGNWPGDRHTASVYEYHPRHRSNFSSDPFTWFARRHNLRRLFDGQRAHVRAVNTQTSCISGAPRPSTWRVTRHTSLSSLLQLTSRGTAGRTWTVKWFNGLGPVLNVNVQRSTNTQRSRSRLSLCPAQITYITTKLIISLDVCCAHICMRQRSASQRSYTHSIFRRQRCYCDW